MEPCDLTRLQAELERKRRDAADVHVPLASDIAHRKRIDELSRQMGPLTPDQFERKRSDAQERERERLEMARVDRLRAFMARRGERYAGCRVATYEATTADQQALVEQIARYGESITDEIADGRNIVLFGKVGTGKDHLLCALARHAILVGKLVDWWNGLDMFGRMRDRMTDGDSEEAFIRVLARPDVLYLSDPLPPDGAPLTPFQMQFIVRVIDARYSRCKATWVSVNTTGRTDFEQRFGTAAVDRLCENALAFFCNWQSHRKSSK